MDFQHLKAFNSIFLNILCDLKKVAREINVIGYILPTIN